jgi:glycosyltransferase involved in cell wall biosynthesis
MKVLFVASGNKRVGKVSAFVQSQYDSLVDAGLEMILFPVIGKGLKGHIKAILSLRKLLKREKPDIIHAHYSVCGYVATIASLGLRTRVVVSILGSFPRNNLKRKIVRFFINHVWSKTLVKSQRTAKQLSINLPIIPNGVNLSQFSIIDYYNAKKLCNFEENKKYIIWCSNPDRKEKRYNIAREAVDRLGDRSVVLFPVYNRTHDEVVNYMCAADVMLLSSFSEGSPNVIKEAMACNCPIVSSNVGDVPERLWGLDGCFVLDEAPRYEAYEAELESMVTNIRLALDFNGRTKGRDRIINDKLTIELVADRIIELYKN